MSVIGDIGHPTEKEIPWVMEHMETNLVRPFPSLNVKRLFEIAPWSLIFRYGNDNKAYAAFVDYPCQDHFSTAWYKAIQNKWWKSPYCDVKTMFLHFLVSEPNVKFYLEQMLKSTFRSIASLEWCCIVAEKSKVSDTEIQELFVEDKLLETDDYQFWATQRMSYIPKVGIRSKRSEDYLALKNMFSQIYDPFKNDDLQKFTLDFLDYGEDKCPTFKYFTYDDDNTFIGIADNNIGEAVGFIYATIQRVDLELLNGYFQLETVYGLRKKHPADKSAVYFEKSDSGESSDEEDDIRELVTNIVEEVATIFNISTCVKDIIEEVCDLSKTRQKRNKANCFESTMSDKILMNSSAFDLNNSSHLRLITRKNIKYFRKDTLLRLINSPAFDPTNNIHIKLVPHLGDEIQHIKKERLKKILNSPLFDPSLDEFATISIRVMSYMAEHKLELFRKSSIGYEIYEKLMYQKAQTKLNESSKTKKIKTVPKLSFKDAQIILHYTQNQERKKELPTRKDDDDGGKPYDIEKLKYFHYRNMGFISGLAVRGKFRIQGNCLIPKIKEPFGYEKRLGSENRIPTAYDIETCEKYPVFDLEKERSAMQEIPYYNGGTNCFYVEQFAIENDYESQSLYLIMAAFEYFPRVDYCMLLLPYGTRQVSVLRSHFSTIPARPFNAYGKELYVFHRAAFNRPYNVRLYKDDLAGVQKLIASNCLKEYLLTDLENSMTSKTSEMRAVVLLSEDKVFAIAIVKEIKEAENLRRNFNVSETINMKYHKYRSQGLLLHCVIHPIFKYVTNIFLKEVMRLCYKSILYYKIYPTHLIPYNPSTWQSLCNVLEQFFPLKPIKKSLTKTYIVFNANENSTTTNIDSKYYCLSYTCTKVVLKDKNINSSRIVVIGYSDIALGVLESLIYRYDCKYTNLTIVSKCGIRGEFQLEENCYNFLPINTDYTKSRLGCLCLSVWVTVVRAEVISIENNSLLLQELSSGCKPKRFSVGFDYLVVCSDLEFQVNYAKKSENEENQCFPKMQQFSMLKELYKEVYTVGRYASNVFCVNNAEEAAKVLNWLWKYFLRKVKSRDQPKKRYRNQNEMERDKKEGRIVIYGNHLEAYTALAVIINENFPLSKITFIKRPSKVNISPFYTKFIEEVIDHVLERSGLEIISNATIEYDKEVQEVKSLDVITAEGKFNLDCCTILHFHEKIMNFYALKTLHKSSLSFTLPLHSSKGHPYLLINEHFQTNFKNVFAAGIVTEIHKKCRNFVRFEDCDYNEREVGMIIGENLNKETKNNLDSNNGTLPILSIPVTIYAKLPSEYFYIFIRSPSSNFIGQKDMKITENSVKCLVLGNLGIGAKIIPRQEEIVDSEQRLPSQQLMQEESKESEDDIEVEQTLPDEPEYFSISFDETERVKAIECLTKKDIDVIVLKKMYGLHIKQIHKMIQKVQDKESTVLFHLAKEWILPLDYIMFEEGGPKQIKRGYNSYWRPGYPKEIKSTLNSFLEAFSNYKGHKK